MKIEWVFQGFLSCREAAEIVGATYRLKGSVPELTHTLPIYDHPMDVQVIDGRSYAMKPPHWESELYAWLKRQQEVADSCSSFEEYVKTATTMIGITK